MSDESREQRIFRAVMQIISMALLTVILFVGFFGFGTMVADLVAKVAWWKPARPPIKRAIGSDTHDLWEPVPADNLEEIPR